VLHTIPWKFLAISEDLFLHMEAFTCLLYGGKEISCVNDLRLIRSEESAVQRVKRLMPQKILPPCRNCLREHLKRVNYQVGIWKRAHVAKPVYPEPTHDNGWQCVDGMIEPKWHDILNISIFQFHSSTNDLNNEYCKWPNSIENWRDTSH
jgi:hypothetical protein